jgi:hypothetical protein
MPAQACALRRQALQHADHGPLEPTKSCSMGVPPRSVLAIAELNTEHASGMLGIGGGMLGGAKGEPGGAGGTIRWKSTRPPLETGRICPCLK